MSFTRRFTSMPSIAVILAVAGIIIVDAAPAVPAQSAPFGKVCIIGETEDGPFNEPTDLLTSSTQASVFGLFGFTYGSNRYRYACALRSGGLEPWNGNLYLQTTKLIFAGGSTLVRVDTSVGAISLTPRAYVQGSYKGPFIMTAGQTFIFNPNASGNVTATFAATSGYVLGTAGTFNSFTGGETLVITINGGSPVTVTFQPGDTTIAAIISRINAAFGVTVASNAAGQIRVDSTTLGTGSSVAIAAGTARTTLGLGSAAVAGTGDAVNIAAVTFAEFKTKVEAASALVTVKQGSSGFPRVVSKLAGTGSLAIGAGTGNAALGFAQTATAATAAIPADVNIPAGTRASDGGVEALRVVTMQTTKVVAGFTGTTLLRVRPAVDDGTFAGIAVANDVDTLEDFPGDLEWSVGNPLAIGAALTPSQLDSAYLAAIAKTVGVGNDITKRINGIVSARQSDAIRAALPQNAISTSANGHFGRRSFICPPNGTDAAVIIGSTPSGVSPYRAEENTFVPGGVECILQELIDGGYATDGVYVRHPDTMAASRWGSLAPGFNPGQLPEEASLRFPVAVFRGLEAVARAWDLPTYTAFKAAGVMAAMFDKDDGITFESGVTAVNPATDPNRIDIGRKTLSDNLGDTFSSFAGSKVKRQGTESRRLATKDAIAGTLDERMEEAAGDAATIERYTLSVRTDGLPAGVVEYDINVKPVNSDNVIIFNMRVGATVDLTASLGAPAHGRAF